MWPEPGGARAQWLPVSLFHVSTGVQPEPVRFQRQPEKTQVPAVLELIRGNLCFSSGKQMWELLQRLVDRTRASLDLEVVKTIFGFKRRPRLKRLKQNQWGIEVETPTYDLTVFHVHYGKLSLKVYSKGEN